MPTSTFTRALLAIVLLVPSLAACETLAPNLRDRAFLSVAVTEAGAPRPLVAGTRIALRFAAADLGATAGCNTLGGTYRMESGRLLFEPGAQTAMGCAPDLEAQDAWLVAFLDSDPMVRFVGNELTLDNGSIAIRLLDREIAEPDLNIAGPTWTVESIIDGDTVSSVPAGATATLHFKADGSIEVDAGCNRGSGTWRLEGAGIRVENLILTKMACAGAGAMLEGAVLGVLEADSNTADIKSNMLTLQAGANGLQFEAK